jgi:hypothetical protein
MKTLNYPKGLLAVAARVLAGLAVAASVHATPQAAAVYAFSSGFETDLSGWSSRNVASPDAALFADPLNPGNRVLGFTALTSGGDLLSNTQVSTNGTFTLSFDYLGVPGKGGKAGNLGGYIGVSGGSEQVWVASTSTELETPVSLVDDGLWHSYSYTFSGTALGFESRQALRVAVGDWKGSGGVAGDAFFDNIALRDTSLSLSLSAPAQASTPANVPEPGSLGLVGLALAAALAGAAARRRRG